MLGFSGGSGETHFRPLDELLAGARRCESARRSLHHGRFRSEGPPPRSMGHLLRVDRWQCAMPAPSSQPDNAACGAWRGQTFWLALRVVGVTPSHISAGSMWVHLWGSSPWGNVTHVGYASSPTTRACACQMLCAGVCDARVHTCAGTRSKLLWHTTRHALTRCCRPTRTR